MAGSSRYLYECRAKPPEPLGAGQGFIFPLVRNKGGTAKEWPFVL